ncbi:DNA/RNA non-specific endonuclease [Paenibacillus hodogayensis]|uniref:DNA/RNA non-specific endonuclease n=1 Tax=Paenibacillus hodogayensis TaxID=279208 RepID=A0ABV5W3F8_9BACL
MNKQNRRVPDLTSSTGKKDSTITQTQNRPDLADLPPIELLQRSIGNRATGMLIQRKLTNISSDTLESPAGAIRSALGNLPVSKMLLPGSQPAEDQERPKKVEAEITKKTLRDSDRKNSGNLSKVTTMARAEQVLLQGADVKKFYDAGHLVADQLVGGTDDSFTMWNLAPQASEFNAPAYAQVMEEEVKKAAKGGRTVKVEVEVDYPDGGSYDVRIGDLLKRNIVPWEKFGTDHVRIGSKLFPNTKLDEAISIPRRIPTDWKMDATVVSGKPLPAAEKPASSGENAAKSVPPSVWGSANPTIGEPYAFSVSDSARTHDKLVMDQTGKRTLIAKQWAPSVGGARAEDVASLVSHTFPDLGSNDEIIAKLMTDGGIVELLHKAATDVSESLKSALTGMTKLLDPTLLDESVMEYGDKIQKLLQDSHTARQTKDLKNAVDFLVRAKQMAEDMIEEIRKAEKEQAETFTFPLSTARELERWNAEFVTPKERESVNLTEASKQFKGGSYEPLYLNDKGGEFRFFSFGVPADINEAIRVGPPIAPFDMVVVTSSVFQESPGLWRIAYKHPGSL